MRIRRRRYPGEHDSFEVRLRRARARLEIMTPSQQAWNAEMTSFDSLLPRPIPSTLGKKSCGC